MKPEILGEQVELAIAAQILRIRLVPDALRRHDRRHLFAMLDIAAQMLARVAPLYVRDEVTGAWRELAAWEREGSSVSDGGSQLLLKDGRRFGEISVRRADLHDAIALLRTAAFRS